jgi:sulfite exporter TauE/SafE
MDIALILSAALMGLAGTPHCLAMCGPACVALGVTGNGRQRVWSFHLGRLAGYAAGGAVAAGGISVLGAASAALPMLRPLWSLLHVAALGLGLWLLVTARQPAWVERLGRRRGTAAAQGGVSVIAWRPVASSFGTGTLWAAWPCGLLQSAIVVAALANGPASGAAVMAAFAIASGAGLAGGTALWLGGWRRGRGTSSASAAWAVRAAGLMLAVASAWALGHGLWMRVIDYCFG